MLAGDWKEEEGLVSGCQAVPVCPGSPCDVLQAVGGATALSLGGEGGNSSAQSPLVKEHSKHVLRGGHGKKEEMLLLQSRILIIPNPHRLKPYSQKVQRQALTAGATWLCAFGKQAASGC